MNYRPVIANGRTYQFCPAAPPARSAMPQSLLRTRLVDEITGAAPLGTVSIKDPTAGLAGRVAPGGLVGLVGRPRPTFGALLPPTIGMRVLASGYVPVEIDAATGAQPDYPDLFDEIVISDIDLHRQPVVISGRAIARNGAAPAPVAAADVAVAGYWATLADVEAAAPMVAPDIVCLLHPASVPRPAALASVRSQPVLLAGQPKELIAPTIAGRDRVRISNVVALVAGNILAIDHDDVDRIEYIEITAIEPVPNPLQSADVTLRFPLARDHEARAPARRADLAAPGPANALARAAIVGDSCLFMAASTGLPDDGVMAIAGGGPATEYRRARRLRVVTDAEGDFRLPPISRVAMVEITGNSGAFLQPAVQRLRPLYGAAENRIEVTFR
jgi:hypothetical protein